MKKDILFKKYQGTGNDFIMVNNMKNSLKFNEGQIKLLCDRKFGIGADGLILLEPDSKSDFYVNYYNSDGTQSFCGNGSRCSVQFAFNEKIISNSKCLFQAIDGFHKGEVLENGIKVSMKNVETIEELNKSFVLDTGSPHYVTHCVDLKGLDLISEARKIRYNERFKVDGINVNFIEKINDVISMRTYERGVEGETLSCGTGVTAVALCSAEKEGFNEVKIQAPGGQLVVTFFKKNQSFSDVYLQGATEFVFSGSVELDS